MWPLLPKLFAALLCAGLFGAALYFPFNPIALAGALLAYATLLWFRPNAWLFVVPALLPVLDLAPWTGWFFLDELDLLLLTTAAFGYVRIRSDDRSAALPGSFSWSLGVVLASALISAAIGLLPWTPLDANAFSNYSSHFNSLRVAKGFVWAVVLLPLVRRAAGPDLVGLARYFVPGMLLGLASACLAVTWERVVFPGLLNFASDYRPTAPFSAMHTGGAALDAYLALSFPFVAAWLLGARRRSRQVLALLLALLGCYAGLTTFSRDMYLAYGTSGALLLALLLLRHAREGRLGVARLTGAVAVLALLAFALHRVFASSGYRGLACALMLLMAAFILGGAPRRLTHRSLFVASAVLLATLTGLLAPLLDKGAYFGFGSAAAVFALGGLGMLATQHSDRGLALAAGAFPSLALGAILVARHWGGAEAMADAAILAVLAVGGLTVNRLRTSPLVSIDRNSLTAACLCAIAFATVIPVSSSYYLGSRFATVGDDLSVRVRHWTEAIEMMDPDLGTSLFGMGLGRYPEAYAWRNTHNELPGVFSYEHEGGNLFLRLGAPLYEIGYGEVLRLLQHTGVEPGKAYRLGLDLRVAHPGDGVAIALCERWLLYPQNCVGAQLRKTGAAAAAGWVHYESELNAGTLGARGLLAAPVQLEIAVQGANALVDVDNLSLRESDSGAELLRNGTFSQASNYWFFSSDRNHFPWHIKNFAVNTFFEQGWIGVAAVAILLLFLCADLVSRALHGDIFAAICLAALAGFLVVGMFDSLFDVPRLTLLFFLVAFAAAMRPAKVPTGNGVGAGRRRRVRREAVPEPEPSETPPIAPRQSFESTGPQAEKSSNAP